MVISLVWLIACWAVVCGSKACCFKHAASSEGVGKYGGEIVVKLVGWVSVVRWEGSSDVFKNWAARFFVEECSDVWVNVGLWWEVDVFPLSSIGRVVYGEGEFEVVGENIVW